MTESHTRPEMIRGLEEISLNCWPALQTEFFDGWVLRFADGYSRRSNSVNPLCTSLESLPEKIRFCERRYRENGLRVVFKLTAASEPEGLDAALELEGYGREAPTSVQTRELDSWQAAEPEGAAHWDEPAEEWLAAQFALNNTAPRHVATARKILALIEPPRRFAALRDKGRIVACGVGMIRQGRLGLYDIVVDGSVRRRGFGRRLMESLLNWGKSLSASAAVLQVMMDNSPALALYAGLGFREEYRYWYRAKD